GRLARLPSHLASAVEQLERRAQMPLRDLDAGEQKQRRARSLSRGEDGLSPAARGIEISARKRDQGELFLGALRSCRERRLSQRLRLREVPGFAIQAGQTEHELRCSGRQSIRLLERRDRLLCPACSPKNSGERFPAVQHERIFASESLEQSNRLVI